MASPHDLRGRPLRRHRRERLELARAEILSTLDAIDRAAVIALKDDGRLSTGFRDQAEQIDAAESKIAELRGEL